MKTWTRILEFTRVFFSNSNSDSLYFPFYFHFVYLSLSGVNPMLRKIAGAAASKPHVEIKQNDEHFYIKTSTTVRTTEIYFHIGEEFNEETVDGRKCKVNSHAYTLKIYIGQNKIKIIFEKKKNNLWPFKLKYCWTFSKNPKINSQKPFLLSLSC